MPNPENITKVKRTPSEARSNGRKGGVASGKARRARRTLKEELLALLDVEHQSKSGEVKTMREIISIGLLKRAAEGDPSAYKTVRETIGEDCISRIDMTTNGKDMPGNGPTIIRCVYEGEEFEITAADVD